MSGGVCALVELAGEVFDGEGVFVFFNEEFAGGRLDLGLGENELGGLREFVLAQFIKVVALHDARSGDGIDSEVSAKISDEVKGLAGELRIFFDEKAVHRAAVAGTLA